MFLSKLTVKNKVKFVLAAIILVIGLGLLANRLNILADTSGGSISGLTYDDTGNILSGVNVSVQGNYTSSGNSINITSNSSGRYSLSGLKENAVVTFSKDGTAFPESFDDVPDGYWAQKQIAAIVKSGIASGYSATKFDPEKIVTRDQMATFIARAVAGGDSSVPVGPSSPSFSDVPASFWAYKYIEFLNKLGIASGYSGSTYKPSSEVTRDQMAVFLSRAVGLTPYNNSVATFSDVPKTHWAYSYIEAAYLNGIVTGYSSTEFRPNEKVTRAQMSVFLMRTFSNYPLTQNGYKIIRGVYTVKAGQTKTYDIYLSKQQSVCTDSVSVSGRVFNSLEKGPLRGVQVLVDKSTLPSPYNENDRFYGSTTDSAGYFEFGCLPKSINITIQLESEALNETTKAITLSSTNGTNSNAGIIFISDNRAKATLGATVKDSSLKYIPESYLVLDRFGQKYPAKIASNGNVSLEVPPGVYELSVQSTQLDKIVYYKLPVDKSFANLKAGTSATLDLTGLAVEREEGY